jgi:hypothetical protein
MDMGENIRRSPFGTGSETFSGIGSAMNTSYERVLGADMMYLLLMSDRCFQRKARRTRKQPGRPVSRGEVDATDDEARPRRAGASDRQPRNGVIKGDHGRKARYRGLFRPVRGTREGNCVAVDHLDTTTIFS